MCSLISKAKARTAPFTELRVSDFIETWDVLADLVWWSAHLEVFDLSRSWTLEDVDQYDHPRGSAMSRLHSVLLSCRTMLRSLRTCGLVSRVFDSHHWRLASFNLQYFPALAYLSLTHGDTGVDPRVVHQLLAPCLRVFCWDLFVTELGEALMILGQPEENWLCALVRAAARVPRGTSLRRVEIAYAFKSSVCYWDWIYPWDRLENAATEMIRAGVVMWWNTPSMTKGDFERMKRPWKASWSYRRF